MEGLPIASDSALLNKVSTPLPLDLFSRQRLSYHVILLHMPIYPLCLYNCSLFSFQYYATNFTILSKIKCMSIYYCINYILVNTAYDLKYIFHLINAGEIMRRKFKRIFLFLGIFFYFVYDLNAFANWLLDSFS